MRKPIIAGNWKMNKTPEEAKELVSALIPLVKDADCDVVVCVPAADLAPWWLRPPRAPTSKLGAQNVHFAKSGAYTGELSADMLKACGVEYVVIGHSERRQYFGETDKTVNLRTRAAVEAGLKPHHLRGRTEGRAGSRLHRYHRGISDADGSPRPDRRGSQGRCDRL